MSEIEKEYSADKIGQRVGWVRVNTQVLHDQELIGVDIVAATVTGDEGALFGSQSYVGSAYARPIEQGFSAVTAFSALFGKDSSLEGYESNLHYGSKEIPRFYGHTETSGMLLDRGTGEMGSFDTLAEKQWAESGSELLDTLRQLLSDADFAEIYPKLYYWMNGMIGTGIPLGRRVSRLDDIQMSELLLTDPSMHQETLAQYAHSQAIAEHLEENLRDDTTMLNNLTIFSEIPSKDIPDAFATSRERARELHVRSLEHVGKLAVKRLVYAPVGIKRSWPYMDASVADADKAYGQELAGLKQQSVRSAEYELEREVKELIYRHDYAADAAYRFNFLADQEKS